MRVLGDRVALAALLWMCIQGSPAQAASYFVDSGAGKDSNSGLTETAPWKTLAKVNATAFPFGSTVYLKRGARWNESIIVPSSGLTIDAYGSGAPPTLDSSVPVTRWTSAAALGGLLGGSGTYSSPAVPVPANTGGLGNLSENGVMLSFVPWNGTASITLNNAASGSYTYDYYAGKFYIKPASNPNDASKSYRASTLRFGIWADNKTDITVQNLAITRFSLLGVEFSNCTRCTARNLTITNGGGAVVVAPNTYAGNGLQWSGNSSYGLADGLVIQNLFDSGISPQTFAGGSNLHDIEIRNSTIDRAGYAGVEVALLGFGTGSSISNISISDLAITNAGRGWSGNRYGQNAHGVLVGDDPRGGVISGVTVQRTTVTNSVGNGIDVFGEVGTVTLNRLRLSGNAKGVYARAASGQGLSLKIRMTASIIDANRGDGFLYLTPSGSGFELFHNTFYKNGTANIHVSGQSGLALLENNVLASDADLAQLAVDNLVNNNSRVLYGATVDHNCYTKSTGMVFYNNVSHASVTSFGAATGFESNGAEAARVFLLNPNGVGLANPAGGDFRLNSESPCVAQG
ncbi:MAG: right-handed parallel beta-helix repeat-containing protein [Panacagrimonas sp.]